MNEFRPYVALNAYLRDRFGERVLKIPLDAGFSCPNRDGTLSHAGCSFCNALGSGSGLLSQGVNLAGQWEYWREQMNKKRTTRLFLAYLQSFSNTYGPAKRLRSVLRELENLPGRVGLCIGTRPDCLDEEKLDLLAALPGETWIDLGLQSCRDTTLKRINRGHDAACFARATTLAAERGLKVCAHLIAGLPGEGPEDFLAGIDFINALPVAGIKMHNLYVCTGSPLADEYRAGRYVPWKLYDYTSTVCAALARLRPGIVIHRLTGDPAPGELLAPNWSGEKTALFTAIHELLTWLNIQQGMEYDSSKQHIHSQEETA